MPVPSTLQLARITANCDWRHASGLSGLAPVTFHTQSQRALCRPWPAAAAILPLDRRLRSRTLGGRKAAMPGDTKDHEAEGAGNDQRSAQASKRSHRRHWVRGILFTLLLIVVAAVIVRALLPGFVRDYVNRTLDRNQAYAGTIGIVQMHLWRGAYSISDVQRLLAYGGLLAQAR